MYVFWPLDKRGPKSEAKELVSEFYTVCLKIQEFLFIYFEVRVFSAKVLKMKSLQKRIVYSSGLQVKIIFALPRDKTNKITCAPS